MRYEQLPRVEWEPLTYMSFDPDTNEYLGKSVYWQTIKAVPENLSDIISLCQEKGINFSNLKFFNHDIECTPCVEKATGREGFYDHYEEKFKTTEEMLNSFDINNMTWSIKEQ